MTQSKPTAAEPGYRTTAFTHWGNLALLAVGGIGGAVIDPAIWIALVAIEGAVLWILPDLPPFRMWVDKNWTHQEMMRERAYYLQQLWGVRPLPPLTGWAKVAGWFAERDPHADLDDRVMNRTAPESQQYLELRAIVARLRELVHIRGARITEIEINRFEQVINGFLRLLIACQPLARALKRTDERTLRRELEALEAKTRGAEPAVRAVLSERQRLLEGQIERIPRLQATLELMRTRAEAIVYQLHNIHSQVLADPGTDINTVLDEMVQRHDMMNDPIGQLESDQMVRDFLSRTDVRAQLEPDGEDDSPERRAAQRQSQRDM